MEMYYPVMENLYSNWAIFSLYLITKFVVFISVNPYHFSYQTYNHIYDILNFKIGFGGKLIALMLIH